MYAHITLTPLHCVPVTTELVWVQIHVKFKLHWSKENTVPVYSSYVVKAKTYASVSYWKRKLFKPILSSVSQEKFKILSLLFHCNIGGKWKILLECLLILHRQKNADVVNIWRVGIRVRVTVIHKNRIMCYGVCVNVCVRVHNDLSWL